VLATLSTVELGTRAARGVLDRTGTPAAAADSVIFGYLVQTSWDRTRLVRRREPASR